MNILAPSILSADFGRLGEQIQAMKDGGAQCVHFDVMDGHFVPEVSFGEPILRSVRKMTDLILDAHLMVTNPADHVEAFAKGGADYFTFHYEAMPGGGFAYGGERDEEKAAEETMLTSSSSMNTKCWLSSWAFNPLGGAYCFCRVVMM